MEVRGGDNMPISSDSLSPHANSNPAIVSGIRKPPTDVLEDGIDLEELPVGAILALETGHNSYRLENLGEGNALLSGHPTYCPEPVVVQVQGSIGAAGELKWRFLAKGAKMVFLPPGHGVVRTSTIKSVQRVKPAPPH
jgi:hypothetical protein